MVWKVDQRMKTRLLMGAGLAGSLMCAVTIASADVQRPAPTAVAAKSKAKVSAPIRTANARPVQGGFAYADRSEWTVARKWSEVLLEAIRGDFARPTVHARNLYHISAAMYDAWAAYDDTADGVLVRERRTAEDIEAAREEAISYAANRLIRQRFEGSPGEKETFALCNELMMELGFDPANQDPTGDTPSAVGNRIAMNITAYGYSDGSNEVNGYENLVYEPVNDPLIPDLPGNPSITDPNRWQPLSLQFFIDQAGNPIPFGYPDFLSPEWGWVKPFALTDDDKVEYERDGVTWTVYHDPGPPPMWGGEGDDYYKWGSAQVAIWSSHLDPANGVMMDASPASVGNAPLAEPEQWEEYYNFLEGGDWGTGYDVNPTTGQPYAPQMVPLGDYGRILAEFWADGPDSETPPGHWFSILNYVNDHPLTEKRFRGSGEVVDDLEWDVKTYLIMGGTMHDVAISAWSVKGWHDYVRPVSAIRFLADLGQSSDPKAPSYDPGGITLEPGFIEIVTEETIATYHSHLAGKNNENLGKIALLAWRGPEFIEDPVTDVAGVGWILAENWWPYQRPSFVTPPFAGYVSGHSTYSRAAARIMEFITGDEYFPGGLGEFHCPQNEYLVFEEGPSVDITLQWARYMDASDQCSLSRIWGGIHPGADDIPGRHIGEAIAPESFRLARSFFNGVADCPGDIDADGSTDFMDLLTVLSKWGDCTECPTDLDLDGTVGPNDLVIILDAWGGCP